MTEGQLRLQSWSYTIVSKSDTFYILDFDRCIADTNALFDAFERTVVKHTGLTAWSLRNVRHEVEAVGDSFDTATYVRAQLELGHLEGQWHEIETGFIAACQGVETLLPGARELMAWFDDQNLPYGTVTYGEATWQKLKLKAAGLGAMPCLITADKHKGDLFQRWKNDDGTFAVPSELSGGMYTSLVLIDDKAVSFDNFPELPSRGYWVLGRQHELPSQAGEVPDNVQRLETLKDVLDILSNDIDKT